MTRFGFNIRTKTGQRVDNIQIMAASMGDAERRLRQMYLKCEIIDRREQPVRGRIEAADVRAAGARVRLAAVKDKTGTH
jgi:DNA-binding helix-hairpin-helix protein with protein kinase domain